MTSIGFVVVPVVVATFLRFFLGSPSEVKSMTSFFFFLVFFGVLRRREVPEEPPRR